MLLYVMTSCELEVLTRRRAMTVAESFVSKSNKQESFELSVRFVTYFSSKMTNEASNSRELGVTVSGVSVTVSGVSVSAASEKEEK